jgi:HK97 family phage prohead protease
MPAMLWSHKRDQPPIGVWTEAKEDDRGLLLKGQFADTPAGREIYTLTKMGGLSGLSIGYTAPRDKNPVNAKGVRELRAVGLYEVSPVVFPMNEDATITTVKEDGEIPTEREFERWLRREAGFTEAQAKTIIAKGYRQVRREAMPSEDASDLLETIRRFGAYAGDQRHGTLGSQKGA